MYLSFSLYNLFYIHKNTISDPEIYGLICFRPEYELLLPIIYYEKRLF
jgi:hypothetical protein